MTANNSRQFTRPRSRSSDFTHLEYENYPNGNRYDGRMQEPHQHVPDFRSSNKSLNSDYDRYEYNPREDYYNRPRDYQKKQPYTAQSTNRNNNGGNGGGGNNGYFNRQPYEYNNHYRRNNGGNGNTGGQYMGNNDYFSQSSPDFVRNHGPGNRRNNNFPPPTRDKQRRSPPQQQVCHSNVELGQLDSYEPNWMDTKLEESFKEESVEGAIGKDRSFVSSLIFMKNFRISINYDVKFNLFCRIGWMKMTLLKMGKMMNMNRS